MIILKKSFTFFCSQGGSTLANRASRFIEKPPEETPGRREMRELMDILRELF